MNKKLNKKGQGALQMLISGAILVLIAVITVTIAISINENIGNEITTTNCGGTNTTPANATPSTPSYSQPRLCGDSGGNTNWTCTCAQWNATASGTTGLATFGNYWVSIVSILILVVIVGLFAYFRGGTGGIEIQ